MPTYEYVIINEDGSEGERFEVIQSMKDDALTTHPETDQPVKPRHRCAIAFLEAQRCVG